MNRENNSGEIDLPVDVSELGEVKTVTEECPGVYYLAAQPEDSCSFLPDEYYIVLENAPISKDARKYGVPLKCGGGLMYSISQGDTGSKIIEYELLRYKSAHGLPLPERTGLHECAIFGAELHPSYFGMLPVPQMTPWGYTTRSRTLANGIYLLETDQCVETLAVSYPIWQGDLSEAALRYARRTDYDKDKGIENTLGYQFFPHSAICVAIFELLEGHSEWLDEHKVNLPALMNAIWHGCPEYAMAYNVGEQKGLHDAFGLLLRTLGYEAELSGSDNRMISVNPEAGTDYLLL